MSHTNPPTPPELDAYVDGTLDPAARETFERAMRADPALAEQVALQRRIDQSLARLFAVPASGAGPTAAPAPGLRPLLLRPLIWSIAAAVLLAGALSIYFVTRARPPAGPSPLVTAYQQQVSSGFTPKEVCTDREQFAEWVRKYYQIPLYPSEPHPGVEFLGWSYAPVIGSSSGVLLARVNGREVIMVIDRKVLEKKPLPPAAGEGLHSFRQEFGPVVLYEITPLDHPSILPLLSSSR